MRVFLTGGSGLLGRAIISELLDKGHSVLALKREKSVISGISEQVDWRNGNILDDEFIAQCIEDSDAVIHAAAMVNFNPKHRDRILRNNIDCTALIANEANRLNKRLIHISSVAALSPEKNGELITEESDYKLDDINTDYALSKYLSEMEVWRAISEGLEACIVNPSIILGASARWHKSSAGFWLQLNKGMPYYPTGIMGFVDAKDVASIARKLLESDISGQRFIADAGSMSYRDFFTSIAKHIGKKPPSKPLKKWMGSALWRLNAFYSFIGGKSSSYSKALDLNTRLHLRYSNQKARELLNHEFIPIEESIERVSKIFMDEHS